MPEGVELEFLLENEHTHSLTTGPVLSTTGWLLARLLLQT